MVFCAVGPLELMTYCLSELLEGRRWQLMLITNLTEFKITCELGLRVGPPGMPVGDYVECVNWEDMPTVGGTIPWLRSCVV